MLVTKLLEENQSNFGITIRVARKELLDGRSNEAAVPE
jgi:hypothetical protein